MLHELSHVYHTGVAELQNEATVDGNFCETCLGFAQLANPASGTIWVLPSIRAVRTVSPEPQYSIIAAAAPAPRSRGSPTFL